LTVLNKADLMVDKPGPSADTADSVFLSATTGFGIPRLLERIQQVVWRPRLAVPQAAAYDLSLEAPAEVEALQE
jgi:50S ribosomal subunit-associated GTPase HflX